MKDGRRLTGQTPRKPRNQNQGGNPVLLLPNAAHTADAC
jgi:hypothetical protein